jgi:hypothetical protein
MACKPEVLLGDDLGKGRATTVYEDRRTGEASNVLRAGRGSRGLR